MYKHVFCCLLGLTLSISLPAQIYFESGHLIHDEGQKIDCLIKNEDWQDSPEKIEYKLNSNEPILTVHVDSLLEMLIKDESKYSSVWVDVDRSTDITNNLFFGMAPTFKKEKLFLKVLIEGEASLYYYKEKSLVRYFLSMADKPIEQLVY